MGVYQRYNRTLKGRFRSGKAQAIKRGYSWELTLEQYVKVLTDALCDYCGGKLSETGSGLDRKDNSKGYILGNVVPCCADCNFIKSHHFSYREMKLITAVLKLIRET